MNKNMTIDRIVGLLCMLPFILIISLMLIGYWNIYRAELEVTEARQEYCPYLCNYFGKEGYTTLEYQCDKYCAESTTHMMLFVRYANQIEEDKGGV